MSSLADRILTASFGLAAGAVIAWSACTGALGAQSLPTPAATPGTPQSEQPRQRAPSGPELEAAQLKTEALEVARKVAEAYPTNALTYALLGSAAYNTGRAEEATKHLQRCVELDPGQADAYGILARIAYEKGQPEESVRLCQEALKRGPPSVDVLNQLGRAYMDMGQTDQAIETLKKAIVPSNPSSESSYLLGQAQLQAGDLTGAKQSFHRAITLLPDHTQAYFGLFTACLRLGQAEEAARYREQFQKLEAVDRRALTERGAREETLSGLPLVRQTVARTLFGAGQIYRVHKEAAKSAELFRRAAALDGDSLVYRAALEATYGARNAMTEAAGVFEQLAAEQPQSFPNYFFLGRARARLNQFEAAERAYRKVQELAPDWPEGYRALADLYLRADRNLADARELARKLVALEPTAPHYYLLAIACAKNNDRPGALDAAKQALALEPGAQRYEQLLKQLQEAH